MTIEERKIASEALRNDIIVTEEISDNRNAILGNDRRWPNGEIYYEIDYDLQEFSGLINDTLDDMMHEIGNRSDGSLCISFKPRHNQTNYILYTSGTKK
jgi:hypothetical protein